MLRRFLDPAVVGWLVVLLTGCGRKGASEGGEPVVEQREPAARALAPGFQEELFISGRTEPVAVRFAPDGRIFVAEKGGQLWAYRSASDTQNPVLVVDLRTQVHNYWDRGMLGLAIDPNFPAVPHVYVTHTLDATAAGATPRWGSPGQTSDDCPSPPGGTQSGCVVYGRLSRIVVEPTTLAGTEQVLLTGNWCQQYPSHSTGDLVFGRDGYLYATSGDGASFNQADWGQLGTPSNPCADPANEGGSLRSQDLLSPADATSLDGTLMRIDVSGPTAVAPPTNPLVGNAQADDDFIVAFGLRNPYRISTRPGTDEVWIADVGWNNWEELNRFESVGTTVKNYGWPCYEGTVQQSGYASRALCQRLYNGDYPATYPLRAPFYTYAHSAPVVANDGCGTGDSSVTGVAFNTSSNLPTEYAGAMFFGDSTRNCIWTMFADANGDPDPNRRAVLVQKSSGRMVDLQMGPDGSLYYVDFDGGNVYRVSYFPENTPPSALLSASPNSGPTPLTVSFDASASNDAEDGALLDFAWDLDADGAFEDATGAFASFTFTEPGPHVVRVRVSDSGGATRVASTTISADDSPPVAVIDAPLASYAWSVGDVIPFAGHAIDPETGPLPPERLSWSLLVHHCATLDDCHTHTVTSYEHVASGSFTAPDHEYPAFLELRLTASDGVPPADWYDARWSRRIALTLPATLPYGTLADFPALVRLDPSRIDYAAAGTNGADLRFTDGSGALLAHEIEVWNPGGVSSIWVKLPVLAPSVAGQSIYLYYAHPSATDGQNRAAVWSNGYRGVWHLGAELADSSGNGNHGASFGAAEVPGAVGGARAFDGVASYLDMGAGTSLALAGTLSLEAFVKIGNPARNAYDRILSKKSVWDAASGFNLELQPLENLAGSLGSGSDYLRANGVDLDTEWHYLATSISGASGAVYVDGVNQTTDATISPVVANTQSLHVGRRSGGGDYFLGSIDEVRVSAVARPAGYFQAQALALRDQLFGYGEAESPRTLSSTTSVILQPLTVDVLVDSDPPGIPLSVGSEALPTPVIDTVIHRTRLSVSAPGTTMLDGTRYVFDHWSDGGEVAHEVLVTQSLEPLIAVYVPEVIAPTCSDQLRNQGETGVDCGGPCPPCNTCNAASYEAETMTHSTGGAAAGGWNLWSNGYAATQHTFTPGQTTLTVYARGSVAANVWPNMLVSVGGASIGSASVNTTAYAAYTFPFSSSGGSAEVRVQFTNDYNQNGQDRNLYVDRLQIDCSDNPPVPTCTDGAKNGSETDTDCGGSCSADCANGRSCGSGNDCISANCVANVCQPRPSGGVTAAITITSRWTNGYCADLTVTNGASAAIRSWSVSLNLNGGSISSSWNANFSATGSTRTVTPLSWNAALAPTLSTTVGFCGSGTNSPPTVVSATGQ
jgi:glucose/arabinose dehydrogenase